VEISRSYDRGKDNAFANLEMLVDGGCVEEIGIENLTAITKAAGAWADDAYLVLIELSKRGLIKKIGVSKLVEVAQKEGGRSYAEYKRLLAP